IADLPASPLVDSGASVGEVIVVMAVAFLSAGRLNAKCQLCAVHDDRLKKSGTRTIEGTGGRRPGPRGLKPRGERTSAEEFVAGGGPLMAVSMRCRPPSGAGPRGRFQAHSRWHRGGGGRVGSARLPPQQWWHSMKVDDLRQQR